MSIWNRLGGVINNYINDFGEQTNRRFKSSGDPDLDAAYEELNEFLNNKESRSEKSHSRKTDYSEAGFSSSAKADASANSKLPPEELRADFEKLGVAFGADEETCKAAYKKLLKIHHPDRHAGHQSNYRKATERTARINASWDKIEKWRTQSK